MVCSIAIPGCIQVLGNSSNRCGSPLPVSVRPLVLECTYPPPSESGFLFKITIRYRFGMGIIVHWYAWYVCVFSGPILSAEGEF